MMEGKAAVAKKRDPAAVAIGERIRTARKAKGMTMEKLAEAAETSTQFLSKVEKGEQSMTVGKFSKVVRALGVSSDYLLFGHDESLTQAHVAAEYLGALSVSEQNLLARVVENLRGALDAIRGQDQ